MEIKLVKGINQFYSEINKRFGDYLCNKYFYENKVGFQSWSWGNIKGYQQQPLVFKRGINFTLQQYKFLVIFCGKIYPAIELTKTPNDKHLSPIKTILYTESAFLDYLTENKLKLKTSKDYNYLSNFYSVSGKEIETEFLITNKITNIILDDYNLFINPKLSTYEFFKVLDVYTCYQELEMWMSGVLAYPQNIMIEVEDEIKVTKHGFDLKYGFRKRPR